MNDAIKLYKTVKNDVEHKKNIKVLTIHGIVISEKVMTIRRMREMNSQSRNRQQNESYRINYFRRLFRHS